jgi:hypothetical protein
VNLGFDLRCKLAVTMSAYAAGLPAVTTWTTVRARSLRQRLGTAPFESAVIMVWTIGIEQTPHRLGICIGSMHLLRRQQRSVDHGALCPHWCGSGGR